MPTAALESYLQELPMLLAEWQLRLAAVIQLPHLTDTQRQRLLREWREEMQTAPAAAVRIPSARLLATIGIKVINHASQSR